MAYILHGHQLDIYPQGGHTNGRGVDTKNTYHTPHTTTPPHPPLPTPPPHPRIACAGALRTGGGTGENMVRLVRCTSARRRGCLVTAAHRAEEALVSQMCLDAGSTEAMGTSVVINKQHK